MDVHLAIPHGMFGLLGPNGAGKTTLMRILATLVEPSEGDAEVFGHSVRKQPHVVRQLLGYLPQEFRLYRQMPVWDVLDYIASLKGLPSGAARLAAVRSALEQVNLMDQVKKRLGALSGGMLRRLGIAQALLGDPRLIIVDEPTAGLDPEERMRFRNLLLSLSGNRVVLLSTHIVGDIEVTCARMAVMDKGRAVVVGTPVEIAELAAGRVWEVDLPSPDAADRLGPCVTVCSMRQAGGRVVVRVLAERDPGGMSVTPTLEEGYVAALGGGRNA